MTPVSTNAMTTLGMKYVRSANTVAPETTEFP